MGKDHKGIRKVFKKNSLQTLRFTLLTLRLICIQQFN